MLDVEEELELLLDELELEDEPPLEELAGAGVGASASESPPPLEQPLGPAVNAIAKKINWSFALMVCISPCRG